MSYKLSKQETTQLFEKLSEKYDIYAPKLFKNEGRFSETDVIKYDKTNLLMRWFGSQVNLPDEGSIITDSADSILLHRRRVPCKQRQDTTNAYLRPSM